jgi:hypothetical protein
MTANRNRLPVALAFCVGIVATFALLSVAHADTGVPDPTEAGTWWSGRLAAPVVLATVIGLFVLDRLAGTRWRWTRWLRVGTRHAQVSTALGLALGVLPAAFSGDLEARAGWEAATAIVLAFKMPGGMEPKPTGDADAPT